jgi:hypothetical protein
VSKSPQKTARNITENSKFNRELIYKKQKTTLNYTNRDSEKSRQGTLRERQRGREGGKAGKFNSK